ncbi:protein-L-isoaspartate(D-aspartate) O-methyltransferase [Labrenzia sp. R4_2]|uniref:protein-L-isoaspartate(D-aspartate) O-methyltransferase n=1 Tax=Labrenzia sp. R4_2 TaxID=2821107 RepID=UPI001ADC4AEC|nr:protein-L-isoaspartate(D-aspartate) O-methyltransferase [Labrenzia sp. R4_2]MBO9419044.1 protein-L-isoaspartate(D-aspartate) O-methyltransferase [Labrenzia sp. R4_2]
MRDDHEERAAMVERQIRARGVSNAAVLAAMSKVPRHLFVPTECRHHAYEDCPLPIGCGQTISQPYVVALMCEALRIEPGSRVLDVGTGSGYAAAVMAEMGAKVIGIERKSELVEFAKTNLVRAGYPTVDVHCDDGTLGYTQEAPYDAVMVAAGSPALPGTLKNQLAIGGRLVIPIGLSRHHQHLLRITRQSETDFSSETLGDVTFVPLIGEEGWNETS